MLTRFFMEFGFCNYNDFIESFAKVKIMPLLVMLVAPVSYCMQYFGLSDVAFGTLLILFALELVTGILKSLIKKQKIRSRPAARWGFKVLVWTFFIFMFRSFSSSYCDSWTGEVYSYMNVFTVMYVIGVYSVSIWENMVVISNNKREFGGYIGKLKDVFSTKNNVK